MEPPDIDARRVAVHTGRGFVDLTLPAHVPIALLLPDVCDIVDRHLPVGTAGPRQLWSPGAAPLDTSKTLSESGIRNGETLILSTSPGGAAGPRVTLDAARALADEVSSVTPKWTPTDTRAAALLVAVILTGAAGLVAVAGAPGPPQLLLAASATGGAAAVASRVSHRCPILFTAIAFGSVIAATAALCTTLIGGNTGALLAVCGLVVLLGAARLTLSLCGLATAASRDLISDTDPAVVSASVPGCLTAVVAAGAGICALGVILLAGSGGPIDRALTTVVSVAVLLRVRLWSAPAPRISVVLGGICGLAATLVSTGRLYPTWCPWLAAAALGVAAGAVWAAHRPSPASPQAAELLRVLDGALLAAVIPLACWSLGAFDTVRTAVAR